MIIDDHRLFVDGLRLVLSQLQPGVRINSHHQAQAVLDNPDQLSSYDLVLVDLQMPGLDGFGLLQAIQTRQLKVKVLVISGTDQLGDIERIMHLGARGFIPKSMPTTEMLHGLREVLAGRHYLPDSLSGQIDLRRETTQDMAVPLKTIGPRQIEVLQLMQDGRPNKQIALILGITEATVKAHIATLFRALSVKNRTACVHAGIKQGLI